MSKRTFTLTGIVLVIAALLCAAVAAAKVVPGQSIAGVKLGDTKAQVEKILGKPDPEGTGTHDGITSLLYDDGHKWFSDHATSVTIVHNRVTMVFTTSLTQRGGLGVGVKEPKLKATYPKLKCKPRDPGDSLTYCTLNSTLAGRGVSTLWVLQSPTQGAESVTVQYR